MLNNSAMVRERSVVSPQFGTGVTHAGSIHGEPRDSTGSDIDVPKSHLITDRNQEGSTAYELPVRDEVPSEPQRHPDQSESSALEPRRASRVSSADPLSTEHDDGHSILSAWEATEEAG